MMLSIAYMRVFLAALNIDCVAFDEPRSSDTRLQAKLSNRQKGQSLCEAMSVLINVLLLGTTALVLTIVI